MKKEYANIDDVVRSDFNRFFSNYIFIPCIGSVLGVWYFTKNHISLCDVILFLFMIFVSGIGISMGFHRCFTHKSFRSKRFFYIILAIFGSMTFQGSILRWVADHRKHHHFSDQEGDVHSPLITVQGNYISRISGFAYSHFTWLFEKSSTPIHKYAGDLLRDRDIVIIDKLYWFWCGVSLLAPCVLGYVISGFRMEHALSGLFSGGFIRISVFHHFTWFVNSVCHLYGYRNFETKDSSRNNPIVAFLTFGEGWHNNHHAFPNVAFHGLFKNEFDLSGLIIRKLETIGLVEKVIYPEKEKIRIKNNIKYKRYGKNN